MLSRLGATLKENRYDLHPLCTLYNLVFDLAPHCMILLYHLPQISIPLYLAVDIQLNVLLVCLDL